MRLIDIHKFRLLIFLISFLILTRFYVDPDFGWHQAIGQKFLEGGGIIYGDEFSWTMPGYFWGNRYFIYQILVAFLYKHVGYLLTAVIFGLIGSLAVVILSAGGRRINFWIVLIVLLGTGVAVINLGVRPHMISFLLFAIELRLLAAEFFKKTWMGLFWFVFFAIWANFHQAFFVGVLILFVFILIDSFWQRRSLKRVGVFIRGLCILVAGVGGLATPFGGQLWKSLVYDLSGSKTWVAIAEWNSVAVYLPGGLIYALSGLVFIYVFSKKFREIKPAWFLVASLLFMLPFLATNFAFFWAAIFIFIATRHFDVKLNLRSDKLVKVSLILSSAAVAMALVLAFFVNLGESLSLENRLKKDGFPVEAVNFIKEKGLSDKLLNHYDWGGYIIWQAPMIPVFIDGRMTGWRNDNGSYILADYLEIINGDCEMVKKYDIRTVLINADFGDKCFANYREIYKDSIAKVLIKK